MNPWIKLSVEYAGQKSYLDDLFSVYPTIPDGLRDIDPQIWVKINDAFERQDNEQLFENMLKLKLFPIKDSYVAYLRKDKEAIKRNPQTVNRLCGRLYDIGLQAIYSRASEAKETNRQMGQCFRAWLNKKALGIQPVKLDEFLKSKDNAILEGSDHELMIFARTHLNYHRNKGLDLVARFNGKYVIGEAKFLTDHGGHQNAQFEDAISTLTYPGVKAVTIAILDGVLYIQGRNKLYQAITGELQDLNIMSSLVLREFLYSI